MSDEGKPLWPWIAAVLIGLPVLYLLSFGPFTWMCDQYWSPHWMGVSWNEIYAPILWLAERSSLFSDAVYWPANRIQSLP